MCFQALLIQHIRSNQVSDTVHQKGTHTMTVQYGMQMCQSVEQLTIYDFNRVVHTYLAK